MSRTMYGIVADQVLANMWSAGMEPELQERTAIMRASMRVQLQATDRSVEEMTRTILIEMGHEITGVHSPRLLGVMTMEDHVPRPGDAVELTGEWSVLKPGAIMILSGRTSAGDAAFGVACGRHYRDARGVGQTSGGPASILPLPAGCLVATDRHVEVPFWRFRRDATAAHEGVDFVRRVRVWEWSGDDGDFDRMSDAA